MSRSIVEAAAVSDPEKKWPAFNKVYLEYFHEPLPARSAFGVDGLVLGGLVELECQAYAGKN